MFQACLTSLVMVVAIQNANAQRWVTHLKRANVEYFAEFPLNLDSAMAQLSSVRAEFETRLGLNSTETEVQVIVFASQASYRQYLSDKIPEAKSRRAIFYQNGSLNQIYTFRHKDLMTDLRHEYTHALLHDCLPFVPLWIDEGLAEFFEEQKAARSQSSRLKAMRWKCRTGWKPSLRDLERIPSAAGMTSDDYRDSWGWIHYLLNSPGPDRLLAAYLQAISAGEAPGAFSQWVTSRDPEVVKRVGSYFRRFQFSLR